MAELLLNPGFESWSSATDCDDWTEAIAGGTSSVNREAVEQRSDPYCVRLDVDAGANNASINQTITLTAGVTYRFAIHIKGAVGDEAPDVEIQQAFGSNLYLHDDGSWAAGWNNLYAGSISTSYESQVSYFVPPTTGVYRITFAATAASDTIYFDDASLTAVALPRNLLNDGGMEYWTSPTGLANWTEVTGGSSTVTRESGDGNVHGGTYSAKLTSAGDGVPSISQVVSLVAGTKYRVSYWHKGDGVGDDQFVIIDATTGYYLQADGSWAAGAYSWDHADTSWARDEIRFTVESTGDYTVYFQKENVASVGYWDDIRLGKSYISDADNTLKWGFDEMVAPGSGKTRWGGNVTGMNLRNLIRWARRIEPHWITDIDPGPDEVAFDDATCIGQIQLYFDT